MSIGSFLAAIARILDTKNQDSKKSGLREGRISEIRSGVNLTSIGEDGIIDDIPFVKSIQLERDESASTPA